MWTSSYVEKVIQGAPGSPRFTITVSRLDGTKRMFKVNHLVLAIIGFGGGEPNIPEFPGMVSTVNYFEFSYRLELGMYNYRTAMKAKLFILLSIKAHGRI